MYLTQAEDAGQQEPVASGPAIPPMLSFRPFPQTFYLKNLARITARACCLKVSPHTHIVSDKMRQWFLGYVQFYDLSVFRVGNDQLRFNVYDTTRGIAYADSGRYDLVAALAFPDADPTHLETCLAFFYWAFSVCNMSKDFVDDRDTYRTFAPDR